MIPEDDPIWAFSPWEIDIEAVLDWEGLVSRHVLVSLSILLTHLQEEGKERAGRKQQLLQQQQKEKEQLKQQLKQQQQQPKVSRPYSCAASCG